MKKEVFWGKKETKVKSNFTLHFSPVCLFKLLFFIHNRLYACKTERKERNEYSSQALVTLQSTSSSPSPCHILGTGVRAWYVTGWLGGDANYLCHMGSGFLSNVLPPHLEPALKLLSLPIWPYVLTYVVWIISTVLLGCLNVVIHFFYIRQLQLLLT